MNVSPSGLGSMCVDTVGLTWGLGGTKAPARGCLIWASSSVLVTRGDKAAGWAGGGGGIRAIGGDGARLGRTRGPPRWQEGLWMRAVHPPPRARLGLGRRGQAALWARREEQKNRQQGLKELPLHIFKKSFSSFLVQEKDVQE